MKNLDRKSVLLWGLVGIFIVGVGAGWLAHEQFESSSYKSYREFTSGYNFITPLLFVEVDEDEGLPRLSPIKDAITQHANASISDEKTSDISIYFRDLNTSQWVAVHPEEHFAPASMLKVITLMTVLRAGEENPNLLSKKIKLLGVEETFPAETNPYPPTDPIQSGQFYSVNTLLKHLVVDSDNGANFALTQLVGTERLRETYTDLGLQWQNDDPLGVGYTSAEYSRVFRSLYNGTYLSRPLSEQVLQLLSTTNFDKGIVTGVPTETVVSHKFGVRDIATSAYAAANGDFKYHELHDCGIVYYPNNPYFLCVMTRGHDLSALESVIQEASRIVWEERSKL